MTWLTDIRDCGSNAAVNVLKSGLGEQVTFSNDGEGAATLWVTFDEPDQVSGESLGIESDLQTVQVGIPRQTNFPPTNGIKSGAVITRSSGTYEVISFTTDKIGAYYRLICQRVQAMTPGM